MHLEAGRLMRLLTVVLLVTAAAAVTFSLRFRRVDGQSEPGLKCPAVVDLGAVANGKDATAAILLENNSGTTITLSNFQTSCSCMAIYTIHGGTRVRSEHLKIAPEHQITVYVDVHVIGPTGEPLTSTLRFTAKEPQREYVVPIRYVPSTALYATPPSVSFSSERTRSFVARRIELRATGMRLEEPPSIQVNPVDRISARFVPPTDFERTSFEKENRGEFLEGFIDLEISPGPMARPCPGSRRRNLIERRTS